MNRLMALLLFLLLQGPIDGDVIGIVVCDTYGSNIEEAVKNDCGHIRGELQRIVSYTEQDLKELIFLGDNLCPRHFLNTLESLSFTKDDCVVFYFSGHGYRTHEKDDSIIWPYLFFTRSGYGVPYEDVLEILGAKDQRLLIAIADCCNNFLEGDAAPDVFKKTIFTEEQLNRIRIGYQKLFLDTSGKVLVTSSDVGQFSWCMHKGAIFTLALIDCLAHEVLYHLEPKWESILFNSSEAVSRHQTPIYEITIDRG